MTKFLKGVVIFYVVLFAVYFFLSDALIKWQLEREGSRLLQAPFTIGKVTFHLLPTSLTLRDVHIGNARLPNYDLVQFEQLSLPLSLRDMVAHKLIVDVADLRGLRFNRLRDGGIENSSPESVTQSSQLREALQRVQQSLNHPMASNTIDPSASISGAVLADQFKPLLMQITTALKALTASSDNMSDWQILVHHANIDGTFDFGAGSDGNSLRFVGTLDNITPQPALFNVVTQWDLRNAEGEAATLQVKGSLDKRKLAQATLRFDLNNFPLKQWPLSTDPELKLVIVSADASMQAMLSLTGNQFDLNALTRFQNARFDVANGSNDIARVIADVWRATNAFDIHWQANGDLANPVMKMNSSLDVPLANALRQLQSASAFPQSPMSSQGFPQPATSPTTP